MTAVGAVVLAALLALAGAARAAEVPAPGTVFRDCPTCPEMVVVPAGGDLLGADGGRADQAPAHAVTFARPFALSKYEVTFDDWQACLDARGCARLPDDHKWGRGRRPVINLTYAEMEGYVRWLAAATGKPYRLPSEAEWEYAARAGGDGAYWWGDDVGHNRANCRACGSAMAGKGSQPAGSFAANPFGLHDMHGNVWEWVADCWHPDHRGAPADGTARTGGDCKLRVMRGGSWYYFPKVSGSAYRAKNPVGVKSYNIGFRVARDLP
ncbi:MAG: SUMF1/EgtB/PvdO family nonheme iron enzyme [Hyphomicrobiales bacterium]|nr:SUMF1/EgtB/PvdO family nonheme iron enzyme [Hyphomicrobiales bacterium]